MEENPRDNSNYRLINLGYATLIAVPSVWHNDVVNFYLDGPNPMYLGSADGHPDSPEALQELVYKVEEFAKQLLKWVELARGESNANSEVDT